MIRSLFTYRAIIFCSLLGMALSVKSQATFTAQASTREMGKEDYVEVQFAIENAKQIDRFQLPEFPNFTIVQGPSQSTGMSMVNGVVSQSKGVRFVLKPNKTGILTIASASATVDGQEMRTNSLQITVRNKSTTGSSSATPNPSPFNPLPDPSWPTARPPVDMDEVIKPGENINDKIKRNFFIKVDVSKTDCYVGEPIVATYKLYARLRSDSRVTRHPSLNGFSVYDMVDPNDDRVSVEKVNGKNFSVHIIRKAQLIPLQAGDITLDPVELDNNIYLVRMAAQGAKNSEQGMGSLLDRLFQGDESGTPVTQHVVLESKPVLIHVKPLPETGKPADYNGAVGKYSIDASLSAKEVDTGDAAILTITVKGAGNLPVINAPTVQWPSHMESYDMSSKENIEKTRSPLSGSKIFNYSFISTQPGNYTIPAVSMSYFDPQTHSYKSIGTDSLSIQVNKINKKKHKPATRVAIVHDRTDWTTYGLWTLAFLLIAGATVFIYRQSKKDSAIKMEKEKALAALEKIRTAPPVIDPLNESREYLRTGDFGKFYGSLNRAIWKAVSDKLQLPASELNKLNIAGGLRNKGWNDDQIIQMKNVLNECEMKLYTPEYSTSDMYRIMAAAEEITSRLKA